MKTQTITYAYDPNGNITSIKDKNGTVTYQYDERNQLIRENNQAFGKTVIYDYNLGGNLFSEKEYAYTTEEALPIAGVREENWQVFRTAKIFRSHRSQSEKGGRWNHNRIPYGRKPAAV